MCCVVCIDVLSCLAIDVLSCLYRCVVLFGYRCVVLFVEMCCLVCIDVLSCFELSFCCNSILKAHRILYKWTSIYENVDSPKSKVIV